MGSESTERRKVFVAGLVSAGKTTYLASLWYTVRRSGTPGQLRLVKLPESLEHLEHIVNAWLGCEQADHTSASAHADVVLNLRQESGAELELSIPEYSGEAVRDAWVHRRWPPDLVEYVTDADAVVLLIHPNHVIPHVTIENYTRNAAALKAGKADPSLKPSPFDTSKVPSQTMLVEFLQFLHARAKAKRVPVAVVVSAWDLTKEDKKTPSEWLAFHLPLLHQFLVANQSEMASTVFGVSAQGSDWAKSRKVALDTPPANRPFAVDSDGNAVSDVSAPVAWAISASQT